MHIFFFIFFFKIEMTYASVFVFQSVLIILSCQFLYATFRIRLYHELSLIVYSVLVFFQN